MEDEEVDCPNNARLFQIAVSNNLKNIAESVRKASFTLIYHAHQLTFEEFHEAFGKQRSLATVTSAGVMVTSLSRGDRTRTRECGESEFLEILTILKSNPNTAKKLHKVMIKELYNSMNNDLEDILKEGSLHETLTKIAKLSEESITSANKYAWRPPGNVTEHMRSLDACKIKKATEELEKQVNEIEKENETLMRTIAESRSKICAMNNNVLRILNYAPDILQRLEDTYEHLTTCLKTIEN